MTTINTTEISQNKKETLDNLLLEFRRDTPTFYDPGECEVHYVPVEDGEIRVFHHMPEKRMYKRPIVFAPGFGTTPWSWREFHQTHHNLAEYYHIETRDKKSNRIKRHRKVNYRIEQLARDIAEVIKYFNLTEKDYILTGACMCAGVILQGLINKNFNPPTTIVFDPFTKWTQNRFLIRFIMPILPPFLFGLLKYLFAKIILANMKNEAQKQRNMTTVDAAVPWIWRKFSMQNLNYDLTEKFKEIENEVFVFHGPKDKYHPEGTFEKIAERIPKGRFFLMKASDEDRELLAGIIATSFASITKDDGVPANLSIFEIDLHRSEK